MQGALPSIANAAVVDDVMTNLLSAIQTATGITRPPFGKPRHASVFKEFVMTSNNKMYRGWLKEELLRGRKTIILDEKVEGHILLLLMFGLSGCPSRRRGEDPSKVLAYAWGPSAEKILKRGALAIPDFFDTFLNGIDPDTFNNDPVVDSAAPVAKKRPADQITPPAAEPTVDTQHSPLLCFSESMLPPTTEYVNETGRSSKRVDVKTAPTPAAVPAITIRPSSEASAALPQLDRHSGRITKHPVQNFWSSSNLSTSGFPAEKLTVLGNDFDNQREMLERPMALFPSLDKENQAPTTRAPDPTDANYVALKEATTYGRFPSQQPLAPTFSAISTTQVDADRIARWESEDTARQVLADLFAKKRHEANSSLEWMARSEVVVVAGRNGRHPIRVMRIPEKRKDAADKRNRKLKSAGWQVKVLIEFLVVSEKVVDLLQYVAGMYELKVIHKSQTKLTVPQCAALMEELPATARSIERLKTFLKATLPSVGDIFPTIIRKKISEYSKTSPKLESGLSVAEDLEPDKNKADE